MPSDDLPCPDPNCLLTGPHDFCSPRTKRPSDDTPMLAAGQPMFTATVGAKEVERDIASVGELLRLINGGARLSNVRLATRPLPGDTPALRIQTAEVPQHLFVDNGSGDECMVCTKPFANPVHTTGLPGDTGGELVQQIAKIIDPHSFMDIPFTDDPVLLEMVEQSKGDARRKAERILTSLTTGSREAALEAAGNKLSLAAQTSGGTAGRDEALADAIAAWAEVSR